MRRWAGGGCSQLLCIFARCGAAHSAQSRPTCCNPATSNTSGNCRIQSTKCAPAATRSDASPHCATHPALPHHPTHLG